MLDPRQRQFRRLLGAIAVGIDNINLHEVDDPRDTRRVTYKLPNLLAIILVSMAAGARSAKDFERLTEQMNLALLRRLGFDGKVGDTTVRDLSAKLEPDVLRGRLVAQVRKAWRRKQLAPTLPFGVVAIDGKYTACDRDDGHFAQGKGGQWRVGTMTAALVSAQAPVCIDAFPVVQGANEMSLFGAAFADLVKNYGSLGMFRLVTTDAGMTSRENGALAVAAGYDYLFAVKRTQPTLLSELDRLLGRRPAEEAAAHTVDVIDNQTTEIRRVWITNEIEGFHWEHARTGLCIEREVVRAGETIRKEQRFYVSSVGTGEVDARTWLRIVRAHWRVENEAHGLYDRFLGEDDHSWFRVPKLALVGILLRRLVANMLILYRNVTLRGEDKGLVPWPALLDWLHAAVLAAERQLVESLRWPDNLAQPTTAPPGSPA